jgi:hypothetical protein
VKSGRTRGATLIHARESETVLFGQAVPSAVLLVTSPVIAKSARPALARVLGFPWNQERSRNVSIQRR